MIDHAVRPVQDGVSIVGYKRLAVLFAYSRFSPEFLQLKDDSGNGKGNDFNRNWRPRAEPFDQFRLVHDDDHAPGRMSDDFLSNQRSAQTFDQIQLRRYFVGAVDGNIDMRMF